MTQDYEDVLSDVSNIKVIRAARRKYRRVLDNSEFNACRDYAIVTALKSHKPGKQNFCATLHRYMTWKCNNALARRVIIGEFDNIDDVAEPVDRTSRPDDRLELVYECMEMLDPCDSAVISQYYVKLMTYQEIGDANGYSKVAAYKRVVSAMTKLRKLCMEQLGD